ncbi:LacI family DNA-binding transcriptional regulator [Paramicrobacterium agarici]|uniref:LacI family transcriptional regulator n=1 Tax=Paramicrobacterium agarici TaxID=630514 RepID=A0A2A9DVB5_9MICO|nr:LacI family DNA-binding transcriptional regulator [Microbacterium agarici]PFG30543.1 LacI family transcriptional regulator [Microbacterium agarici]TQO23564.1 LacI family transcriptional regulator [Microbacterium agarici]
MARRATIHDVAREAGVSVATVSKAVNGRYGIAPPTVRRVLDAVDKLGYESSLVASSMRSRRTGVVGVLVADFEPFSAEILKGVGAALHESELDLLAYSGTRQRDSEGWERRSLSRLSGTLIDGAIMVTPTVVGASSDIPIVAVDPHTGRADLPTVESDSFGGALQATRHLVELGHERIGFVAGRPDLRSSTLREAGYRQALREAGIPFDQALVRVGRYEPAEARERTASLLASANRPTAIFAANDISAIAVLELATSMGLTVPRDLSIVGFDDIPEASRLSTPLTTVRQSMQRLGTEAVTLLLALMNGETTDAAHIRLATALIPRATTAPPRHAR